MICVLIHFNYVPQKEAIDSKFFLTFEEEGSFYGIISLLEVYKCYVEFFSDLALIFLLGFARGNYGQMF